MNKMKTLTIPASALALASALACAAGLAACGGGGGGDVVLGGSVTGLNKSGLVLANGATTLAVAANVGSFAFPGLIASDANYHITIQTQPTGAVCQVVSGTESGKASSLNVTTVQVSCLTNQYKLGGSVSGLSTAGLQLVNGGDTLAVAAGATSFTFGGTVGDGAPYGVTILSQPTGLICAVSNGGGTLGSADVNTVAVACR